ncbi:MAG: 3-dehydro-L-gulonate 2-dehydrogenase [Bacteroidales bacterium]|nr:3-dehydro-L-gulonate 2-dehydrogenase [Bacteroidales bacterium]
MNKTYDTVIIDAETMRSTFNRILIECGFSELNAAKCAEIFTKNTLDGVFSHGVNRFAKFVNYVKAGYVVPEAVPSVRGRFGSVEQWDGNLGPGPLNASRATERAIEISAEYGMGMVAMANTNHWMRGGTYGWQAALKGFVFLGWTNTMANMPAWGATDPHLGNNPLVIAVPWNDTAIVLDFAMSQYSYGVLESYKNAGRMLPFPGGFSSKGELTDDPGKILESWRSLPIGYWKGSSLSLLLDILASILSGGLSVHEISKSKSEYSLSQVFIALNIRGLTNFPAINDAVGKIIADLHRSIPVNESARVRYPGEDCSSIRHEHERNGIPVSWKIWKEIEKL